MERAARRGYATATDLADYLVKKGLPFRDAHEVVAHAVKAAQAEGRDLAETAAGDAAALSPIDRRGRGRVLSLRKLDGKARDDSAARRRRW